MILKPSCYIEKNNKPVRWWFCPGFQYLSLEADWVISFHSMSLLLTG